MKGVSSNFKGVSSNFKVVSRVVKRSSKHVSGKFEVCFNAVSRVLQEKITSRTTGVRGYEF